MLFILSAWNSFYFAAFGVASLAVFIILLGESKLLSFSHFKIDISYGVYLYHCPVMQTLSYSNFLKSNVWFFCLSSLVFTFTLSFLSAKLIEEPTQRWARKLVERHRY
jgi:peptidoglycan/LPS O-acetylase OafA/YrhL